MLNHVSLTFTIDYGETQAYHIFAKCIDKTNRPSNGKQKQTLFLKLSPTQIKTNSISAHNLH